MSVRLYGRDVGNGSLAVVTRGFREVLEGAGLLDGFVAIDRSGGSEEDESPPGALARDAVFTGNLSHQGVIRVGTRHERHWVQVTPNSTHVPPRQLAAILELPNPHILSASEWGTQVIANSLVDMGVEAGLSSAPPIHTVHHGISGFAPVTEELDKTHDDFYEGKFRVVHFSTTEGERKGTLELLQAWPMFLACGGPVSTELILVLDYHARMALKERMNDIGMVTPQNVLFLGRGDLDAATMSGFLCRHHLVCAPSRGEGFSLAPLESRACGVPVVTTTSTGNSAGHCEGPGVIPIHQNPPLLPIDDGPGALALAVEPGCIAEALALARGNWLELSAAARKAAPQIARDWSWQKQLAPLVEQLR